MNSIRVLVPNDTWLSMGGGDETNLLRRLGLPDVPGVEVGPSTFQLYAEGAFVSQELRHPGFPDVGEGMVTIAGLERARELLEALL